MCPKFNPPSTPSLITRHRRVTKNYSSKVFALLFFVVFIVVYNRTLSTPSHPLDHAIATKFYLSSRDHAINLIQFTITPVNFDLPLDFYGGACRNLLKIRFLLVSAINLSTTESQLIAVSILKATLYFVTESMLPLQISENSKGGSRIHATSRM